MHLGFNRRGLLETFGDTVEQATECRYETCLQSEPLPFEPSHGVLDIVLGDGVHFKQPAVVPHD